MSLPPAGRGPPTRAAVSRYRQPMSSPAAVRRTALGAALLLALAACGGGESATPGAEVTTLAGEVATPSPEPATPSSEPATPGPVAATPGTDAATPGTDAATPGADAATLGAAVTSGAAACGPAEAPPVRHPDWAVTAGRQPDIIPLVVSSLVEAGPSRFLYSLTDAEYRILASPEVVTRVSFYALERDPETPVATLEGTFLDTLTGRGLYRVALDFDCAGEWGMELEATLADGSTASERLRFRVHPDGPTVGVGEPAPRSESLTASSVEELRQVTTDPNPYPGAYERTVGEVVASGHPSLVLFATPAFCQTGTCGPTVDMVKAVALDYADRVGFVNVEPYKLHMTENGLQPELDAEGRLQPVQAVLDYGIPVEPYLFVVDAAGDVFMRFEGVVGEDELRAAVEDVLAVTA
jgi:hypothetical protein